MKSFWIAYLQLSICRNTHEVSVYNLRSAQPETMCFSVKVFHSPKFPLSKMWLDPSNHPNFGKALVGSIQVLSEDELVHYDDIVCPDYGPVKVRARENKIKITIRQSYAFNTSIYKHSLHQILRNRTIHLKLLQTKCICTKMRIILIFLRFKRASV